MTVEQIKDSIQNKLRTQFACDTSDATAEQLYQALAMVVRDEIMQRRSYSRDARKEQQAKKLYYLSAEFLIGRALHNNMVNLVNESNYMQALDELHIGRRFGTRLAGRASLLGGVILIAIGVEIFLRGL